MLDKSGVKLIFLVISLAANINVRLFATVFFFHVEDNKTPIVYFTF